MKIPICCNDWITKDNGYVCALARKNAICLVENGKAHYLYSTNGSLDAGNLYTNIFRYGFKTIFLPFRAKAVLILDETNHEFREIDITSFISVNENRPVYFNNAFLIHNTLHMVSNCTSEMMLLNLDTEHLEKVVLGNIPANRTGEVFSRGNALLDNSVFLPLAGRGAVLKYSLKDSNYSIIDIPGNMTGIHTVTTAEDSLLIWGKRSSQKCFVSWNYDTNEYFIAEVDTYTPDDQFEVYHQPLFWNGVVYIFAYTNHKSYFVDLETHEIKEFVTFNDLISDKDASIGVFNVKQNGSILTFQTKTSYLWGEYDLESREIIWKDPDYLDDRLYIDKIEARHLKEEFLKSAFVYENKDIYDLRALINAVTED